MTTDDRTVTAHAPRWKTAPASIARCIFVAAQLAYMVLTELPVGPISRTVTDEVRLSSLRRMSLWLHVEGSGASA